MKTLLSLYGPLLASILLTVYAQLGMKKHMMSLTLPEGVFPKIAFLLCQLVQPLVLSVLVAAFAAGLIWMSVVAKYELSLLYPIFISSTIVLVFGLSVFLFNESISILKLAGMILVVVGLLLSLIGR